MSIALIMAAAMQQSSAAPPVGDPAFANVGILSVPVPISSVDNYPKTGSFRQLGPALPDSAISKFGTQSLKINSAAAAISLTDELLTNFGTGDFCIEGWFNKSGVPTTPAYMFSRWDTTVTSYQSFIVYWHQSTQAMNVLWVSGSTSYIARFNSGDGVTPAQMFDGAWHHVAAVRNGTELAVYVDGIKGSTTVNIGVLSMKANISAVCMLGALGSNISGKTSTPASGWDGGSLDEWRVTKGLPRYTAGFTPPTAAFPRDVGGDADFANVSSIFSAQGNWGAYTYGQAASLAKGYAQYGGDTHINNDGFFSGSQPAFGFWYTAHASHLNLAGGDFCIEMFGAQAPLTNGTTWLSMYYAAVNERGWKIRLGASSSVEFVYTTDGATDVILNMGTISGGLNTPRAYCLERTGSDLRFYQDGVQLAKVALAATIYHPATALLKYFQDRSGVNNATANTQSTRYAGTLRITKAARYSSDGGYTVPTLPLPTSS